MLGNILNSPSQPNVWIRHTMFPLTECLDPPLASRARESFSYQPSFFCPSNTSSSSSSSSSSPPPPIILFSSTLFPNLHPLNHHLLLLLFLVLLLLFHFFIFT